MVLVLGRLGEPCAGREAGRKREEGGRRTFAIRLNAEISKNSGQHTSVTD